MADCTKVKHSSVRAARCALRAIARRHPTRSNLEEAVGPAAMVGVALMNCCKHEIVSAEPYGVRMESVEKKPRRKRLRKCPVCGGDAWPIAYGMVGADAYEESPETYFAGCCIDHQERVYPSTGKVEYGVPKWACQNDGCRHQWW